MTDLQSWVAPTYDRLADLLAADAEIWDAPSLCEKWLVRHVVAHVTMPARLTPELFGAEMAAAGGDFGVLSDTVAARDAALPVADLLGQLRSPQLHGWQPPGGGAAGALSHAVIHSLDVSIALGRPAVAPAEAVAAVLGQLGGEGNVPVQGPAAHRSGSEARQLGPCCIGSCRIQDVPLTGSQRPACSRPRR